MPDQTRVGAQGVRGAQGVGDLRGALARLEAAVQGGFISPLFRRGAPPVAAAWLPPDLHLIGEPPPAASSRGGGRPPCSSGAAAVAGCGINPGCRPAGNPDPEGGPGGGEEAALAWLPATAAAVALRLAALDAALAYRPGTRPAREVLSVRAIELYLTLKVKSEF